MISLNKKNNQGFTIVELLIVIVVIGILALLVITTYSGIQQKARNSKRQVDIKSLQTQLEGFYSSNGYYPSLANMTDFTASTGFLATKMKSLDQTALSDPSNTTQSKTLVTGLGTAKSYAYNVTNDAGTSCESDATTCTKYTLTATYEGTVNGSSTFVKTNLN